MKEDSIIGNLHIHICILGSVRTNCYILCNKLTNEAIVIDPADQANVIIDYINNQNLLLKGVLLTHGHFDHILAAAAIAREYGVKIYANENERELLADSHMNFSKTAGCDYGMEPDEVLKDGQVLNLAGFKIKVIHTPGHTIGSSCYYLENEKVLFSGDTLFRETVGRTDLPTGNFSAIISSVKEILMLLEDEVLVYPGHGESTTIGYERENNEYLNVDRFWE
ncbi:glyoxylase-like metal-dependent hydrolase (beta-lactamase superfamily II) [Mobilisporobacter senegalensis]|uniref:Glyoxylase-like metal-dependent hydrolase (Beta-lactamase superfamily II) n=1 Tax=Mobilisporobacter senegalensis TaxID=1329262 RepID=A0A3N1XEV9_9FIRM|nr:MBL fold metallo-hydrolase [Mobilisporobacter senegalensis]ROR25266.1 glyoxylase-like metal-dependent hydrolase (beta-lactamase superfamily II) [Mobilisporobacter senegalensis]